MCSVLREMPPCTSRGLVMRPTRDFYTAKFSLGSSFTATRRPKKKRKGLTKRPFFQFQISMYCRVRMDIGPA